MHYEVEILEDYLQGELGPERDAVIYAHLESCAPCRATCDSAAALRDWLQSAARAEEREFPSMIKARVWEAVRAQTPGPFERLRALWRPWAAVPLAAMLALVAYVGVPAVQHAGSPAGVAATYLLEEHAAATSVNPLADRGLIVPASMNGSAPAAGIIEAADATSADQ